MKINGLKPMLKKVQPKVWWAALAVLVILVVSWGLVRKKKSGPEEIMVDGKMVSKLDPVPVKNPDAATAAKIAKIEDIFRRKKRAGFNGNVLIVQKGQVLYQESFGFAHL